MRRLTFLVVSAALVAGVAGVAVPAAAAEQLHATVVSWSPNDVRPDEPVSVTLQLYTAERSPYPQDGQAVAGVEGVEVIVRGGGPTRAFATEDIGGGRYRTEIIFPNNGGWDMRVRYGPGRHGPGDEIQLGKGGICVGAPLCDSGPLQSKENVATPLDDGGRTSDVLTTAGVAVAAGIALAIGLSSLLLHLSRRRRSRPAT